MADHHHKIFNSNDYIPKRFGLNYSPPQIIIEYLAPSTGKLYHHKMRLHKFKKEKNNAEIIKELYERHQVYLDKKKVSSEQLIRLIERLKQNFVPRKKKNDAKIEENKNDEKKEIKKEVKQEEKKEEKKEEKSSEIEEDFDFGEVESSMKEEKEKDKDKKKEIGKLKEEKPKEVEKKKEKNDPELEEEEEEYGFDEFEDEDLNKLNDSELKKKKAEMDVEFEKNNIKKDDANFKYDIRKEFDHEQYAAEWDDESY